MQIRDANEGDIETIRAIWNDVIRHSLASFNSVEKSAQDVGQTLRDCAEQDRAFLVAEIDGAIAGFATYFPFRNGVGYARTREHTIMLDPAFHGRGAGRALMAKLEAHAASRGVHSLFAGVSAENPSGIAFHERLGYVSVVTLREVGFKNEQWLDLVLMQKFLKPA